MRKKYLVSIVVTTKNEEKNIENCLLSIIEQTYENIEIIVVDNGSIDRTKEIARQYTELVFEKGPERSAQRNYGMIDISKGKYVMFVDADMILSQCIVENCVAYIEKSRCLALHIPEVILGNTYWSKVRRLERSFYDGTVVDGARFFNKESFIEVGGFDKNMSGPEDWDIDMKIKQEGSICLIDKKANPKCINKMWSMQSFIEERGINPYKPENVIYHNESEFCINNYLIKKGYYAKSFDTYIEKWGKNNPCIRMQFGFWYRFIWVFLENGKWKKLFANVHIALGIYLLRIFVGVTFIIRRFK
jgi:glycosyltransferase involved in cell wall biosynthesis